MSSDHTSRPLSLAKRTSSRSILRNLLARRADPDAPRRVLSKEEAQALALFVYDIVKSPSVAVTIHHRATSVVTQRHGHAPRSIDVDDLDLFWGTRLGSAVDVTITTNVRDIAALRRVMQRAIANQTPPMAGPLADEGPDPTDMPRPATYAPVSLWYPSTIAAIASERGTAITALLDPLENTAWQGIGTVALSAQSFWNYTAEGATPAWGELTDVEISLSVRAADGSASGWSGQANRDWSKLRPAQVAQTALANAEQQRNPSRAEPGRYTAILSPTAMGQMWYAAAHLFNVQANSPFNPPTYKGVGDKDRRGERVMDPRVILSSDPTDPEGGDWPFFYGDGGMGEPNAKSVWVENGILKLRSVDAGTGMGYGMIPRKDPWAMRMNGGPSTVAEMITKCERGIYVHRFANLEVIDGNSGAMSGYTRDGCLLIMNGKISRPVKDFRIFESPFLMLNRLIALGKPERIAFGFTPPKPFDTSARWPLPPMIVPPVMVTDFNFSALADAI